MSARVRSAEAAAQAERDYNAGLDLGQAEAARRDPDSGIPPAPLGSSPAYTAGWREGFRLYRSGASAHNPVVTDRTREGVDRMLRLAAVTGIRLGVGRGDMLATIEAAITRAEQHEAELAAYTAGNDLPDPVHHGDVFARVAASNPVQPRPF